jgi:hypothetical protein
MGDARLDVADTRGGFSKAENAHRQPAGEPITADFAKLALSAVTSAENARAKMSGYLLTNLQGRSALEIWPLRDLQKLWHHLHNGNGPFDFVMGFRDRTTGAKHYARSKKLPVERAISWALATVQGRKKPEKSLAFVPYSTNAEQMSRWGGFDFDAHDGDNERPRRFAFDAFRHLLNCEFAVILESSGSGGWHVWAIARDLKPVAGWIRLLKGVARDIGASVESGVCEIFPPDTLSRGFGKGLRAPGAWNPCTNTLSEIYWQNADHLITGLPPCVSGKSRRIGEVVPSLSDASSIEKTISLSPLPLSVLGVKLGDRFQITQASTRHGRLAELVGSTFNQLSRIVAEQIARAQFAGKTVATNASEADHMTEFGDLWERLERRWYESLSEGERERFSQLSTDAERGAFRIILSYERNAAQNGHADFPIARDNLGERVGISGNGAGQLRMKFVRLGIIAQTTQYRANVAAARYRWTANFPIETKP